MWKERGCEVRHNLQFQNTGITTVINLQHSRVFYLKAGRLTTSKQQRPSQPVHLHKGRLTSTQQGEHYCTWNMCCRWINERGSEWLCLSTSISSQNQQYRFPSMSVCWSSFSSRSEPLSFSIWKEKCLHKITFESNIDWLSQCPSY